PAPTANTTAGAIARADTTRRSALTNRATGRRPCQSPPSAHAGAKASPTTQTNTITPTALATIQLSAVNDRSAPTRPKPPEHLLSLAWLPSPPNADPARAKPTANALNERDMKIPPTACLPYRAGRTPATRAARAQPGPSQV